ncbi:probable BOI-related E3 ubiquitin-protein ligase 2 [Cornus florida]|uniref:probable BOI-related E3 ubiquitin-protein ligase 2 n=1 Tax=Cornus florida TaxID=4283 RepID=UPI0028A27264|nr:probable BOI-related E3 ubiquitin-protein ligase 2 [Cornus florida]
MAVQAQLYSENLGWLTSSVLGIEDGANFNFQEHPQHQVFQSIGFNSYNNQGASCSSSVDHNCPTMEFSLSLAAELEKQRQEIDWVLRLQSERLRTTLQEETRQQIGVLLKRYEAKTMSLMWEKEEDLVSAKKRTMELEECLRRQELEMEVWQRIAKENEATVTNLNTALQQARERVSLSSPDAESFCDSSNYRVVNNEAEQSKTMACRLCNARSSCIVFLPCRHLCSCKLCEAFVGFCPVCQSLKKASVEVLLA